MIASLPSGEAWSNNFKLEYKKEDGKKVSYKKYFKSLKEQYIEKRNSIDWHLFENEVSAESSKIWEYYRDKAFDMDSRVDMFNLKDQWGLELNRDIRNFLIIRRLYLAFWFNKTIIDISFRVPDKKDRVEDPVINIYSILRGRFFDDIEAANNDDARVAYSKLNNASKVFVNQLSIEPKKLPQGVLPEEKAWLAAQKIDITTGNSNLYDDEY